MKFSLDILSTSEADKLAGKRNIVKERNRGRRTMTGKAREMSEKCREESKHWQRIPHAYPSRKLRFTSIPKARIYMY